MTKATDRAVETDWATKAAQVAFRGHAMDDYDDIIAATAAALRKERERCAGIVAQHRCDSYVDSVANLVAAIRTPRGK